MWMILVLFFKYNIFSAPAYFNLNSGSPDLAGAIGTLQEQKHFQTLDASHVGQKQPLSSELMGKELH